MTDLIADLNRIHAGASRHVLHGDMPADPAELATVCRRAVEALTPPEDVGELVDIELRGGAKTIRGWTAYEIERQPERAAEVFGKIADRMERAADRLSTLSAALALVTRERDEARAQVDACAEYLKPGETPAERIKREHDDCCALMAMLAKDRERRDAAEGQVSALTAERDRLRIALEDLTSWFDDGPSRYGPWIIKAGDPGADAAVEFARAALTPGRGADESGEAGA